MVEDDVQIKFARLSVQESDINEHMSTLRDYAKVCDTVCEMGARETVSTFAFLHGMRRLGKNQDNARLNNARLFCVNDSELPCENGVKKAGLEIGVDVTFINHDSATLALPNDVDLLFIDTWHVYAQLKRELAQHQRRVKKFIIMHDTTIDGEKGELVRFGLDAKAYSEKSGYPHDELVKGLKPAIDEFLAENSGEWVVDRVWTNNNGLTVLKRSGVTSPFDVVDKKETRNKASFGLFGLL